MLKSDDSKHFLKAATPTSLGVCELNGLTAFCIGAYPYSSGYSWGSRAIHKAIAHGQSSPTIPKGILYSFLHFCGWVGSIGFMN